MIQKGIMVPPWCAFNYHQRSMGWRMGGGEDYLLKWGKWFRALSQQEQQTYIAQYPEPEDWFEFYQRFLPHTQEEHRALIKRTQQLRNAYCKLHYQLATLHEEAKHYEYSVEHLGNVLFTLKHYQMWNDEKITEIVTRYASLKKNLTRQMAQNPAIRASWNFWQQGEKHLYLKQMQTTISLEDYERLREQVFFPSELGRTWIKCFEENNRFYIHRHWREPCLFLVKLEVIQQEYHITKAWMNLDPAISRPLTRPEQEPNILLRQLLSLFLVNNNENIM